MSETLGESFRRKAKELGLDDRNAECIAAGLSRPRYLVMTPLDREVLEIQKILDAAAREGVRFIHSMAGLPSGAMKSWRRGIWAQRQR